MNLFEVPRRFGSPEAQFQLNDQMFVEIVNFLPSEHLIDVCVSHHQIVSWMSPRPIVGQARFAALDGPNMLDMGKLQIIPAGTYTLSRFLPTAGRRRGVVFRFAPTLLDKLQGATAPGFDPSSMANLNLSNPYIDEGMRQLAEEAMAPGLDSSTLIEAIGTSMLVRLLRSPGRVEPERKRRGRLLPWQMRRITERIADEGAESAPSAADLATVAGISVGHLRQIFKESTGCTIGEYVRSTSLERARALLAGSPLPIKCIATRLGFSSQYGFTLAFRRSTGETPSAFRLRMRTCHDQDAAGGSGSAVQPVSA